MISHDKHFDCCLFTVYIILSLVYSKKIGMREKCILSYALRNSIPIKALLTGNTCIILNVQGCREAGGWG